MENMKRVVSLMLCIVMVFGLLPMTVFATDVDTTDEIFEEYFEEEVEVSAPVVGNENPVNPEEIIFEEEIIEETAPVVDNEDPVNPVTPAGEGDFATPEATVAENVITKTVYVKVDTVKDGGEYLIVNTNAGTGAALGTTTTAAHPVTITEGSLTIGGQTGTYAYIEDKGDAPVWTAKGSSTSATYTSGSAKLGYNYSLSLSTGSSWTYSNNQLSTSSRYLTYSNNTWSASRTSSKVYLYEKTEMVLSVTGYGVEITKGGEVVTDTIAQKKVTSTTTLDLAALVTASLSDGSSITMTEGVSLEWVIADEYKNIATIDQNGRVSFKGIDGEFDVTVYLTMDDGSTASDVVTISAPTTSYSVPADGTTDFPEYPNEGAIRYDKTAVAVGNFAETGIAKMELSMTGVPYSTGSEIDVVIMLDRSSSMYKSGVQHRISSTVAATKTFIESIVKNADGSFNGNRIMVMDFLGGNLDSSQGGGSSHKYQSNLYTSKESNGYQVIDSQAEMEALFNTIETGFKGQTSLYGTEYAQGLEDCYNALKASRADGNQQFCVFMSDGIPNYMQGEKTHFKKTSDIVGMFTVTNSNSSSASVTRNSSKYEYEYYSTQMKNEGVTVYTVGLGLKNTNSAWSGASKEACEQVANMLLNDIAGPAYEKTADRDTGKTVSKKDTYFFSVSDDGSQSGEMKNVFAGIAQKILQAATDVTVEDQITPEYTMIFDVPTGNATSNGNSLPVGGQEFYIEFLKYNLDADHERTGTPTSLAKLYLGKNADGSVYAATNKSGAAYAAPTFTKNLVGDKGTLYYWTTDASKGDTGVSYTTGGKTYYFVSYGLPAGDNNYNMTSGGFASGTVDTTNMSQDLVLATPYFVYNAATKMLYWTVDKLDTSEYVLNYFLYLNNSATEVSYPQEVPAASYPTNDHAYITYTNFNGNECRQEFPEPQMTWNGAQASYVFYLVNAQGQPINKSGQVVDFANATFITDVFTTSIIWNRIEGGSDGNAMLDVNWLASEKLPEGYSIYDEQAQYTLQVHETENGELLKNNQFTIAGGTAAEISASLNSRLNLGTTANTVSVETTKVYNTKAGVKYDDYGTYTTSNTNNFDFANTTVAFAVVWQPKLVEDVVVVDFGLDVLIDVVGNDLLQNTVDGISWTNSGISAVMNTGVSTTANMNKTTKTQNGDTIKVENENQIRFSQGDMEFNAPVKFYYESKVSFYEGSNHKNGYLYSSVTVIPATTIYYEDSFVDLESYTWNYETNGWQKVTEGTGVWTQEGTTINATQAQDRPGDANFTAGLDADNIYGYDKAYENCSEYSMGSAKKAHVDFDNYGAAKFSFYGTGFDLVALTSDQTGTIYITVKSLDSGKSQNYIVDTYYGYKYEDGKWVVAANTNGENALYQIPVMKVDGLTYGHYEATVTAQYASYFDHGQYQDGSYDFYLDAIRIYDPTGNQNNDANDAYEKDGEALPSYEEFRNILIDANSFNAGVTSVNGAMYIDDVNGNGTVSMADYKNYGPNNEVYLKNGNAIAFMIDGHENMAQVHFAAKSANGETVTFTVKNIVDGAAVNEKTFTLNTATDLYYDLTEWKDGIIVIENESDAILSLTNLKYIPAETEFDNEFFAYMTAEAVEMTLRALNTPVVEETEPEVTEPETEVTEPETEPETEATQPAPGSNTGSVVKKIIGIIGKLLGKIFG